VDSSHRIFEVVVNLTLPF